jgi:hypothetical protein
MMHGIGTVYRSIASVALVLLFVFACGAAEVDIGSIVGNPAQFDGKIIAIRGTASAVRETVSRAGNPYATLQVQDKTGAMKVFTFGHPGIKNGECVEVSGVYKQVNRKGPNTFYNEIEAQSVASTTRC